MPISSVLFAHYCNMLTRGLSRVSLEGTVPSVLCIHHFLDQIYVLTQAFGNGFW